MKASNALRSVSKGATDIRQQHGGAATPALTAGRSPRTAALAVPTGWSSVAFWKPPNMDRRMPTWQGRRRG